MKCYYDSAQDAVGICKSCGKGLSTEYVVDLGKGLACRNRCEEDARALIALIDGNVAMRATSQQLLQGTGRTGIISSVFFILLGLTFLISGVLNWESRGLFPVVIGTLFIVWSLLGLYRWSALQRTVSAAKKRGA